MQYKSFENFYHETSIKHILLFEYQNKLVSPPFATELCRDYSNLMVLENDSVNFINMDLPSTTSKFSGGALINDSLWFIPYGIWDNFNSVIQYKNGNIKQYMLNQTGKGQFYSLASNGIEGFSFPLGYEGTNYCLHIKDEIVSVVTFDSNDHTKMHMGTVFCNESFWSPPRGDTVGYSDIAEFKNGEIIKHHINLKNQDTTRKYSEFVVKDKTLFALPYGENNDNFNELIEFDTETYTYTIHELPISRFKKKFNSGVLLKDKIIALPYGDEYEFNSNWGVSFDTVTKETKEFDIGFSFGGKWRYAAGINFFDDAVFFPVGTPTLPIMVISEDLKIKTSINMSEYLIGRPIIFQNKLTSLAYHLENQTHHLLEIDSNYNVDIKFLF